MKGITLELIKILMWFFLVNLNCIMRIYLYILLIAILSVSCKSKQLRKKAYEFEKNGAFEQASQYYYESLKINSDNVDAILGYKKTTQILLDQTYEEFYSAFKNNNYKASVYAYEDAEKIIKQSEGLRIRLQKLNDYSVYYEEALSLYLTEQYNKGRSYLSMDKFSAAKNTFDEIMHFDKKFKDAKTQLETATLEPIYRKGVKYLESNSNRLAYYEFEKILLNSNYKDALDLKSEALEKATIKIAVNANYSSSRYDRQKNDFKKQFISKLNNIPSPFYKIIEIPQLKTEKSLEEKITLAKSKGAKALFSIDLDAFSYPAGTGKTGIYKAYIKTIKPYKDADGKTKKKAVYTKTTCKIYSNSKKVAIHIEYKLISTQDKSVLVSNISKKTCYDKIEYLSYKGNYKELVGGYWKYQTKADPSDKVKDYAYENNKIYSLINSRKTFASSATLYNKLIDRMSVNLIQSIADYDPN